MNEEIIIDKNAKQITFTNNGIGFSQFGIANEILDLIENQTKEIERLKKIPPLEDVMKLSDKKFDELTKIAIKETINEELNKKIKELQEKIDKAIDKIQYIIDYGFDYDGFNNVEDLKGLIDMLVQYAVESKNILKGEDKE